MEHILLDEDYNSIIGIMDFGNAGTGFAAFDLGIILDNLGETLTALMAPAYPNLEALLQRARVGMTAAFWHLRGQDTGDMFWHLAHLMTAKDIIY